MCDYTERVMQELLKELENKEITEDEFWEYYNGALTDYSEVQQSEYYGSVGK